MTQTLIWRFSYGQGSSSSDPYPPLIGGQVTFTTNNILISSAVDQIVLSVVQGSASLGPHPEHRSITYNDLNQVVSITVPYITSGNYQYNFNYNADNRIESIYYQDPTISSATTLWSFAYNSTGRVVSILNSGSNYYSYTPGTFYDTNSNYVPSYQILAATGTVEGYSVNLPASFWETLENGQTQTLGNIPQSGLPNFPYWQGNSFENSNLNRLYPNTPPVYFAGDTTAAGTVILLDKGDNQPHPVGLGYQTGYLPTGEPTKYLYLLFGDYANNYSYNGQSWDGVVVNRINFTDNFNLTLQTNQYFNPRVFPLIESTGINTTISFSNTILINSSGAEQRLIKWQDPLRSFNLTRKILSLAELLTILEFFKTKLGSDLEFLYQDRSDYIASNGQGVLYPLPDGSRTEFQLCKLYVAGDCAHFRAISRPETVVSVPGYNVADCVIDYNTGKIVLPSAPAVSTNYFAVDFRFYVPVIFDGDELDYTIAGPEVYQINKLILKEIKVIPFIYPRDSLVDSSNFGQNKVVFPNNLNFIANNQIATNYDTEIVTLSSGYNKRTPRISQSWTKTTLAQRSTFSQSQLETLLRFWLAHKGNGAYFYYNNFGDSNNQYLARFWSQDLNYVLQSTNNIYQVAPVELRVFTFGNPIKDAPIQEPTDILSTPLLTLARVCNITVPLIGTTETHGFTTSDRDIRIDGVVYKASTAFDPSAVQKTVDISVDNQEIKTIIHSEITEAELASGKFDEATITVAVVDYSNPPAHLSDCVIEQEGFVGEITSTDTYFKMENLTKAASLLRKNVSVKTQFLCRYNFCDVPASPDSHCTLDINNFQWDAQVIQGVSGFNNRRQFFIHCDTAIQTHGLAYGSIYFYSGANAGLEYAIFDNYYDVGFIGSQTQSGLLILVVNNALFYDPAVGDTIRLRGGCNKRFETCTNLYRNSINFGGEPAKGNFMPTNDFYTSSTASMG